MREVYCVTSSYPIQQATRPVLLENRQGTNSLPFFFFLVTLYLLSHLSLSLSQTCLSMFLTVASKEGWGNVSKWTMSFKWFSRARGETVLTVLEALFTLLKNGKITTKADTSGVLPRAQALCWALYISCSFNLHNIPEEWIPFSTFYTWAMVQRR